MQSDDSEPVEVAVVGGGPAGLTAAVALAAAGVETALISAPPRRPDNRTTALLSVAGRWFAESRAGSGDQRLPSGRIRGNVQQPEGGQEAGMR